MDLRRESATGGLGERAVAHAVDLGISDGFLRLSVGLEHQDDIMEDVLAALEKV